MRVPTNQVCIIDVTYDISFFELFSIAGQRLEADEDEYEADEDDNEDPNPFGMQYRCHLCHTDAFDFSNYSPLQVRRLMTMKAAMRAAFPQVSVIKMKVNFHTDVSSDLIRGTLPFQVAI